MALVIVRSMFSYLKTIMSFSTQSVETRQLYFILLQAERQKLSPAVLSLKPDSRNEKNLVKTTSQSLLKDIFASAGGDFIPVVHNLNDNDTVTVNVSHIASIILPLQPEWWLQIADVTGSDQEMEEEICNTISSNWDLVNNGTSVGDCNLTVLETFEQANGTSESGQ